MFWVYGFLSLSLTLNTFATSWNLNVLVVFFLCVFLFFFYVVNKTKQFMIIFISFLVFSSSSSLSSVHKRIYTREKKTTKNWSKKQYRSFFFMIFKWIGLMRSSLHVYTCACILYKYNSYTIKFMKEKNCFLHFKYYIFRSSSSHPRPQYICVPRCYSTQI